MVSFQHQMKQNQSQISLFVNPQVIEINKMKYCSEALRVPKLESLRFIFAKSCTDFYLRVRSRPIIEDCNGVRFGPYCLKYEGIDEDSEAAALSKEPGNWGNVDDFKWLRVFQSPNWLVLPEEERLGTVDLADLGCGNGAR
ncbi:hypothetical protein Patl1_19369 [Pistacia atlantica]|uniref:Uncharacterized protein n=1 Tax=Pistacia atlantica TaxID=434234 RepID=A0ACC1C256_9ROSI|nr:hypothetical protein Patl1_19369 [Pistacia atlantica]